MAENTKGPDDIPTAPDPTSSGDEYQVLVFLPGEPGYAQAKAQRERIEREKEEEKKKVERAWLGNPIPLHGAEMSRHITLNSKSTFADITYQSALIWRQTLNREMRTVVEDWLGVRNGHWTPPQERRFAVALVCHLAKRSPDAGTRNQLAQPDSRRALETMIETTEGAGEEPPVAVREVFDSMFMVRRENTRETEKAMLIFFGIALLCLGLFVGAILLVAR